MKVCLRLRLFPDYGIPKADISPLQDARGQSAATTKGLGPARPEVLVHAFAGMAGPCDLQPALPDP